MFTIFNLLYQFDSSNGIKPPIQNFPKDIFGIFVYLIKK